MLQMEFRLFNFPKFIIPFTQKSENGKFYKKLPSDGRFLMSLNLRNQALVYSADWTTIESICVKLNNNKYF